ncbi:Hypothetical predicted protein, partial [Paramuricea clavata]
MARLVPLIWSLGCVFFLYAPVLEGKSVSSSDVRRTYKLGFMLPFNADTACDAHLRSYAGQYAPAILVAMEHIRNDTSLNFNLTWVWNDTMCNESKAIRQQVWQLNNGVDAFFGPGKSCATTSRNALAFNKPVISYECRDAPLADKDVYKTLARTSINNVHIVPPLLATLKQFKWKRVAIVYQKKIQWQMIYNYVSKVLAEEKNNITIALTESVQLDYKEFHQRNFQAVEASLRRISQTARIVILLMSHELVIEYMLSAHKEGLVQTGEYAFISFQLSPELLNHKIQMKWYFGEFSGPGYMEKIIKSFSALLILQVRPITYGRHKNNSMTYSNFSAEVLRLSREPPFKSDAYQGCLFVNNSSNCTERTCKCIFLKNTSLVPIEAANLYHGIVQYAYALNRTLAKNQEPNGINIIDALKGHTFD